MGMQRTRTIVITTLTATSVFILASPYVVCGFLSRAVDFFMELLMWGSFVIFPSAVLTLAAMWRWRVPPELKVILVIVHLILAALAGFWVWLFWFAELPAGAV